MAKKVFISYCHQQEDWVLERLVPCLRYGGAELLIDKERFKAGRAVIGQMDATQDRADLSLLVLSPDYLNSQYCVHEMNRALTKDPTFQHGKTIPVLRVACNLPLQITQHNPIYVNLQDDKNSDEWDLLLQACKADLGCAAPDWLQARDDIVRYLSRIDSVNLIVSGEPKWKELILHIKNDYFPDLGIVDLESGATASRRGLVAEILKACCSPTKVPKENEDLVELNRVLNERQISRLAIQHFDLVAYRHKTYSIDFFAALRNLIMNSQKLIVIIQSRKPFLTLLPKDNPLSLIDLKTVELKGRK